MAQKLTVCRAAWQGMAGVSLLCFPWSVSDVALQTRKKKKKNCRCKLSIEFMSKTSHFLRACFEWELEKQAFI